MQQDSPHIRRLVLRTDGSIEPLAERTSLEDIRKLINAGGLDTVTLHHWGHPLHVMLVDDLGYETKMVDHGGGQFEMVTTKALKPVNQKATGLYWANCRPGTTHQIVGDVAIVPDEDFT